MPSMTKDEILSIANQVEEVEIDGKTLKIRPLTWKQEAEISEVIGNMIRNGTPEPVADREYMKLVVLRGLVEPKLDETEIQNLKFGLVQGLSRKIGDLSSGMGKKE